MWPLIIKILFEGTWIGTRASRVSTSISMFQIVCIPTEKEFTNSSQPFEQSNEFLKDQQGLGLQVSPIGINNSTLDTGDGICSVFLGEVSSTTESSSQQLCPSMAFQGDKISFGISSCKYEAVSAYRLALKVGWGGVCKRSVVLTLGNKVWVIWFLDQSLLI